MISTINFHTKTKTTQAGMRQSFDKSSTSEMDECGTLKNEMRYFGVSGPRKSYWYNFDPRGYLECAMAGSFGGWEPGDETGRQYVPGPVAVLGDGGSIESANPEDLPNPKFDMPVITWEHFKDFVICGQIYE